MIDYDKLRDTLYFAQEGLNNLLNAEYYVHFIQQFHFYLDHLQKLNQENFDNAFLNRIKTEDFNLLDIETFYPVWQKFINNIMPEYFDDLIFQECNFTKEYYKDLLSLQITEAGYEKKLNNINAFKIIIDIDMPEEVNIESNPILIKNLILFLSEEGEILAHNLILPQLDTLDT